MILPLFPEAEFQLADVWITKRQLQAEIKKLLPDLLDKSCIHSSFASKTGEVVKQYAWNSVYGDINRAGLADVIISSLTSDLKDE